jgi:hypothetical protein
MAEKEQHMNKNLLGLIIAAVAILVASFVCIQRPVASATHAASHTEAPASNPPSAAGVAMLSPRITAFVRCVRAIARRDPIWRGICAVSRARLTATPTATITYPTRTPLPPTATAPPRTSTAVPLRTSTAIPPTVRPTQTRTAPSPTARPALTRTAIPPTVTPSAPILYTTYPSGGSFVVGVETTVNWGLYVETGNSGPNPADSVPDYTLAIWHIEFNRNHVEAGSFASLSSNQCSFTWLDVAESQLEVRCVPPSSVTLGDTWSMSIRCLQPFSFGQGAYRPGNNGYVIDRGVEVSMGITHNNPYNFINCTDADP